MDRVAQPVTADALEQSLRDVMNSPANEGPLEAIYIRPRAGERRSVATAELSVEQGIIGDRWQSDHWRHLPDGSSDPEAQISLMNGRILRAIAGHEDRMALAGDNLIVDFDLSAANVPAGTRLRIGAQVIVRISSEKHTGCAKFSQRYGKEARSFVNSPKGKSLHLRGRYARIIQGGTIRVGDKIVKLTENRDDA